MSNTNNLHTIHISQWVQWKDTIKRSLHNYGLQTLQQPQPQLTQLTTQPHVTSQYVATHQIPTTFKWQNLI
eukprot:5567299-Amphidinium_carterae.1